MNIVAFDLLRSVFGSSSLVELINLLLIGYCLYWAYKWVRLPLLKLLLGIVDFFKLRGRPIIFLEITPPLEVSQSPEAASQLMSAIYELLGMSSTRQRLLDRKNVMSLELVSSRYRGIRFIATLSPADVLTFKRLLVAHLPGVRFKKVPDYLSDWGLSKESRVLEFAQQGHPERSLALPDSFKAADPFSYITGAMTKTLPGSLSALQLTLSPLPLSVVKHLRSKAQMNPGRVSGHFGQAAAMSRTETAASQTKLAQPLFGVDIRVLTLGKDNASRARAMSLGLSLFKVPGHQGLGIKPDLPGGLSEKYRLAAFRERLPAIAGSSLTLSAGELAGLYHFPLAEAAEGTIRSLARSLPAPVAFKLHSDLYSFDVILGVNKHHGEQTLIGLSALERQRHVYVVGGTGNGKTTLLEYGVVQDIEEGRGVALIDPHGDAAKKLLGYIPESRLQDVVYFKPEDIKYPIGLNLLELPEGLDDDELALEKERVAEAVVSVMRKVFDDDKLKAHNIESVLRNVTHTAFTVEGATLFTVLKLLRNRGYRAKVVAQLSDPHLIDFWRGEFGRAGQMQQISMSKGVTHRLDRFETSEPVVRIMGQAKSTINLEEIMNSGKILLCDLSGLGEDTASLFGTSLLALIKIAAERRGKIAEADRRPFYLYVDEFQNFATAAFVKMTSTARKFKLCLTIAEQSTSQQTDSKLTETILANVATLICFRTGSPADERLLLPRFVPWLEAGEIGNLAAYNFYARIQAQESLEPMSGETIPLPEHGSDPALSRAVIAASRQRYGLDWAKEQERRASEKEVDNLTDRQQPEGEIR